MLKCRVGFVCGLAVAVAAVAAIGALTGVSTTSGTLVSATVSTAVAPDLRVTLD